jgi:hypothetical protein
MPAHSADADIVSDAERHRQVYRHADTTLPMGVLNVLAGGETVQEALNAPRGSQSHER